MWDLATGGLRLTLKGHANNVNAVVFSPDARLAVSGSSDKTLKVWDIVTGNLRQTMEGHSNSVNAVAIKPTDA